MATGVRPGPDGTDEDVNATTPANRQRLWAVVASEAAAMRQDGLRPQLTPADQHSHNGDGSTFWVRAWVCHVCMYVRRYARTYVRMYVYICAKMHVYIYMYIYIVHLRVYANVDTDTNTNVDMVRRLAFPPPPPMVWSERTGGGMRAQPPP